MPNVGSVLTASSSTNNVTSAGYTTDVVAPAADAVLVLVVGYSVSSGTAPDPVITGLGLTWEEFTSSEAARSIAIWRAKGTGSSGAITIAPPSGVTYTSGYWALIQFTGADLTSAIGQVGVASGSGTAAAVSLPNPIAEGAATVAGFMTSVQTTAEPRAGWTEAADLNNSAPTSSVQAQYKTPGEQDASATFAATGNWRAVIVSVLAAAGGAPSFTVSAALSGAGTLSAGLTPAVTGAAGLSGSGTLSAGVTPAVTRAAGLSGEGTLSATAPVTRSAGLSGAGTLSAGITPSVSRAAALSGSGTLSAGLTPSVTRSAALSGTGTLTAGVTPSVARSAALSGSGTLSGAFGSQPAAAALSSSGTLSATVTPAVTRSAALSGSGTLSAVVAAAVTRSAALSGSGTLSAVTGSAVTRAAALSGSGTLAAGLTPRFTRTATFTGTGTLTANAFTGTSVVSVWTGSTWKAVTPQKWDGTVWKPAPVAVL